VVASIIGLMMAVAVVALSFRIAGPAPAYTFTNHSATNHSTVTTVAAKGRRVGPPPPRATVRFPDARGGFHAAG
jgi:hypothetical protein